MSYNSEGEAMAQCAGINLFYYISPLRESLISHKEKKPSQQLAGGQQVPFCCAPSGKLIKSITQSRRKAGKAWERRGSLGDT